MQRLLTTATLVGLLIATAAAFAITEKLKLTTSAVYGTQVSKGLSPTCGCARGRARIYFKLRRPDFIAVTVLNGQSREIALLVARHYPRGPLTLKWDGRDDTGRRAADGTYRVQIHLTGQHQTIELPNRIVLDTKPPQVLSVVANRQFFSPDGDHQSDFVRLAYTLSKPAHVLLYVDGMRIQRTPMSTHGTISWFGHGAAGLLGPGAYTLTLGAVDANGNTTPVAMRRSVRVEIRYITLANTRIVAQAGRPFEIGVSTDAKRYSWQLGRRHGTATSAVLRLQAPPTRGRYTLTVTERGHATRAAVFVR